MATLKGCHYDNIKLQYKYDIEKNKLEKGVFDTEIEVIEE